MAEIYIVRNVYSFYVHCASLLFCLPLQTFVILEFTNPFQWIIDLPIYENETRAGIIASILMYYFMGYFAIFSSFDFKKFTESLKKNGSQTSL